MPVNNEKKTNGTPPEERLLKSIEEAGDNHVGTSQNTPLRPDAFVLDNELKKELIEEHFRSIMMILGLDLEDDSLKGTPRRVAATNRPASDGLDSSSVP